VSRKRLSLIFLHNSDANVDVRCSHFTLRNPKRSFLTVLFVHTSDYLSLPYLRRKQTVIHLPTPTENATTLTCVLQNFFIWLNVFAFFQTLEALKRASCGLSSVALEKKPVIFFLWYVATGMSGKQRHSKCSEWPPSALVHASRLFRQWSVAYYTKLCWNSAHVTTSRCRKPQHVNTRAPPIACRRRNTRAMQIIGITKQQ